MNRCQARRDVRLPLATLFVTISATGNPVAGASTTPASVFCFRLGHRTTGRRRGGRCRLVQLPHPLLDLADGDRRIAARALHLRKEFRRNVGQLYRPGASNGFRGSARRRRTLLPRRCSRSGATRRRRDAIVVHPLASRPQRPPVAMLVITLPLSSGGITRGRTRRTLLSRRPGGRSLALRRWRTNPGTERPNRPVHIRDGTGSRRPRRGGGRSGRARRLSGRYNGRRRTGRRYIRRLGGSRSLDRLGRGRRGSHRGSGGGGGGDRRGRDGRTLLGGSGHGRRRRGRRPAWGPAAQRGSLSEPAQGQPAQARPRRPEPAVELAQWQVE